MLIEDILVDGTNVDKEALRAYIRNREVLCPADFDAVGVVGTDDTPAWNLLITALTLTSKRRVFLPVSAGLVTSTLSFPNGTVIDGESQNAVINYNGTGPCILLGESSSALNYNCGARNFTVTLLNAAATAIRLRATRSAFLRDLFLNGYYGSFADRTNVGVDIDGADISAFGNMLDTITCHHMHKGVWVHMTGSTNPTQQFFKNIYLFGDVNASPTPDSDSIGFDFDAGGHGTVMEGGNVEHYGTGILVGVGSPGPWVKSRGMRYESNTNDLQIDSTSGNSSFTDSDGLTRAKFVDNSDKATNRVEFGDGDDRHTWTPVNSSGDAVTISVNGTQYYRNNRGDIAADFDFSYPNTAGLTGTAQIGGLPFNSVATDMGGGFIYFKSGGASLLNTTLQMVPSADDFRFYVDGVLLTNENLANCRLRGKIWYRAAP